MEPHFSWQGESAPLSHAISFDNANHTGSCGDSRAGLRGQKSSNGNLDQKTGSEERIVCAQGLL